MELSEFKAKLKAKDPAVKALKTEELLVLLLEYMVTREGE
jgi:hypothetical protein